MNGHRRHDGTQPPNRRLLVIGLDVADADCVDRWCQEGVLPNLQALRAAGTWGRLRTTAEVMHVSAAPSFHSGAHPGRHGLFHAYQIRPGEQQCHRTQAQDSALPDFWQVLSEHGKRCSVLDAFMSGPREGFGGIQVAEWGTWSWFSNPGATPPELWSELQSRFGPYPAPDASKVLTAPDPRQFRDQLLAGIRLKRQVIKWLMQRAPWDLFYTMFAETHPAGHYLWHLHAPSYMAHPPGGAGELAGALRDIYCALDQAIGEILSGVSKNDTVFVVSVDGMGPNYNGAHLLEEILKRLGFTFMVTDSRDSLSAQAVDSATRAHLARRDLMKQLRDVVPYSFRRKISHFLPRPLQQRLSTRWMTADVDWARTRAFVIPNANEGYIRINMRGREPRGIVEPGAEYQQVCDALGRELTALVNPQTLRPAVREVIRVDEVFPGEWRDHLADLVVQWDTAAQITTDLYSETCGLVKSEQPCYALAPYYTGNHRPGAFFIARGPRIPAGQTLEGGHILDLAPTFLAYFDVATPAYMTGNAMKPFLVEPEDHDGWDIQ